VVSKKCEGGGPARVVSDHIVQLFDTQSSRAKAIWRFVSAGLDDGDTVVVVARPKHWRSAARLLRRGGWPVDRELAAGRLVVLDADVMLASFMRRGAVNVHMFEDVIGGCVSDLVTHSAPPVRIYGEMVDLLAEEANFEAARHLEELWNDLGRRYPFTLLCGYAAAHFTDPKTAASLRAICGAHTHVASAAGDLLGNWILRERRGTAA
jgi:hypothetical protein